MFLFVFKHKGEGSVMESMVRTFSGPYLHVDLIPSLEEPYAYTSYMFEPFTKNHTLNAYSQDAYTARLLQLSDDERKAALTYLEVCAERRVPYNYKDLVSCTIPGGRHLVRDVADSPEPPPSLFCSQAAILCLRNAAAPGTPLAALMRQLNSRTTSPSALYAAIEPLTTAVQVMPNISDIAIPMSFFGETPLPSAPSPPPSLLQTKEDEEQAAATTAGVMHVDYGSHGEEENDMLLDTNISSPTRSSSMEWD